MSFNHQSPQDSSQDLFATMRLKTSPAVCFALLISIGNFFIINCTSSQNRVYINPLKQTTTPQFGTGDVTSVIATLLNKQQRVKPLFFQLPTPNGQRQRPETNNQFGVDKTTVRDKTSTNIVHLQATPKLKLKRAIDVDGSTKVLDGVEAKMGEFTFLASLKQHGRHFCGATILDSYHILTAAHCFRDSTGLELDLDPEEYSVTVGEYDLNVKDRYEQNLRVEHICIHQDYINTNPSVYGSDIAIIRLKDRVQFFRGVVERARLPQRDGEVVDIRRGTADIAGWGHTGVDANGKILRPNLLQTSYLNLYKAKECSNFKGVRSSLLCAGDDIHDKSARARNTCPGDSGGPIICSGVVCGLVSNGPNCHQDRPLTRVSFTRVSYFMDWIRHYTLDGEDNQCLLLD